jgi:hypothetical protein
MDAISPEKLAANEETDIEDRQKEMAEASKQKVEDSVRKQFSLSADAKRPTTESVAAVKRAAADEQAAARGGMGNVALVAAILAALAVAAWFILRP